MEPEAKSVLEVCCAEGKPATVMSTDTHLTCSARFAQCFSESVSLELFPQSSPLVRPLIFHPFSGVIVSFLLGTRTHVLVGSVLEYNLDVDPPRVELEVKSPVASGEARSTFRVPVFPDSGLQVRITRGADEWVAQPVNISIGGILLEFSEATSPNLEINEEVNAGLRFHDKTVELAAIVLRHNGSRYALMFNGIIREAEVEPPRALSEIIREIERQWLGRRVPK